LGGFKNCVSENGWGTTSAALYFETYRAKAAGKKGQRVKRTAFFHKPPDQMVFVSENDQK